MPISSVSFRAFREDCGYQETQYQNLSIPVGMLDNDFRNPDLERFVDRFFEYEPEVRVIGDVDEIDDVDAHVAAARGSSELSRGRAHRRSEVAGGDRRDTERPSSSGIHENTPTAWPSSPTLPIGEGGASHPRRESAQTARRHSTVNQTDTHRRATSRHRGRRLERTPSRRAVRRVLDGRRLGRQRSRRRPRHRAKDGAPQPRSRP